MKLLISLSTLDLTQDMVEGHKSFGGVALYSMLSDDFLKLTTTDEKSIKEIREAALPAHKYNEFVSKKEILFAPSLDFKENGKIVSHEGRHRAASVKHITVVLHPNYKSKDKLPKFLIGQFSDFKHKIDPTKVERLV